MKIDFVGKIRSTRLLLLSSAFLLLGAGLEAHATVITTITSTLTNASPTQLGRPVRNNATPQNWAGDELYPGQNNTATPYNYQTFTLNNSLFPAQYVQIELDDLSLFNNLFISAYANNYDNSTIVSRQSNWLGDSAFSVYIVGDPIFFQVLLPTNASLVLVVNSAVSSATPGLNTPFKITVEDFLDTDYTDLPPVPEPSTIVTVGTGLLGLAGAARRRFFAKA